MASHKPYKYSKWCACKECHEWKETNEIWEILRVLFPVSVDRAAQTKKCTTNMLFQYIYLDYSFLKLMWLLTTLILS